MFVVMKKMPLLLRTLPFNGYVTGLCGILADLSCNFNSIVCNKNGAMFNLFTLENCNFVCNFGICKSL